MLSFSGSTIWPFQGCLVIHFWAALLFQHGPCVNTFLLHLHADILLLWWCLVPNPPLQHCLGCFTFLLLSCLFLHIWIMHWPFSFLQWCQLDYSYFTMLGEVQLSPGLLDRQICGQFINSHMVFSGCKENLRITNQCFTMCSPTFRPIPQELLALWIYFDEGLDFQLLEPLYTGFCVRNLVYSYLIWTAVSLLRHRFSLILPVASEQWGVGWTYWREILF